jgi:hypothetical protein
LKKRRIMRGEATLRLPVMEVEVSTASAVFVTAAVAIAGTGEEGVAGKAPTPPARGAMSVYVP